AAERSRWERLGVDVAFFDLIGAESLGGCYVMDIPAGGQTRPLQALYDEAIYVARGHGSAQVEVGGKAFTFEWQPRSLFAIPTNARRTFFNGSGSESAALISTNTLPLLLDLFRDERFIFDNPWPFERAPLNTDPVLYQPDKDHDKTAVDLWETLFVADAVSVHRPEFKERGTGERTVYFEMGDSYISSHIAEMIPGHFLRPHKHGPSAFVYTLSGEGYSLMWPEGGEMARFDWPAGDVGLVVPPNAWWHGHFALSAPAIQLAVKLYSRKHPLNHLFDGVHKTLAQGGTVARFTDLPEELREHVWGEYEQKCRERNIQARDPNG
ncbi:MAG TPA: hypothetical protein VKU60_09655, partial [Chloroflexota bacterium]|nr:hypothetical protein [Chloroflexota bacterium]